MPGADAGGHSPTPLFELLEEARRAGFLGPGPIGPQVRHAEGFTTVVGRLIDTVSPRLVDLGSGGGLPGLVVATGRPDASLLLIDASVRRTAFLSRAVDRLGLADRVSVLQERAEVCGRQAAFRGAYDAVLSRSFGRPAVAAECGAPFLKVGGWLVVSEPPAPVSGQGAGEEPRWPAEPLSQLGLRPTEVVHESYDYRALRQVEPCPERFPRRNGVPAKRPLF